MNPRDLDPFRHRYILWAEDSKHSDWHLSHTTWERRRVFIRILQRPSKSLNCLDSNERPTLLELTHPLTQVRRIHKVQVFFRRPPSLLSTSSPQTHPVFRPGEKRAKGNHLPRLATHCVCSRLLHSVLQTLQAHHRGLAAGRLDSQTAQNAVADSSCFSSPASFRCLESWISSAVRLLQREHSSLGRVSNSLVFSTCLQVWPVCG